MKISSPVTRYGDKKVPYVSVLFSAQDSADTPWAVEHWRSPVCQGMAGEVNLEPVTVTL